MSVAKKDYKRITTKSLIEMKANGDSRVYYFYYDGMTGMGCQWHPSASDHQMISQKLRTFIDGLPNAWLGATQ